jgi:c-di-AMP phosphodiesterase-like protein
MYGTQDSGCMLAWKYFYPNANVPLAIQYVSDSDTWTNMMPDYKYINSYIYRSDNELTIENFDKLVLELEDKDKFEEIRKIGKALRENYEANVNIYIKKAELINFDGYEVYSVNAPSEIRSDLGHELALKTNSFSVIYYYLEGKWKVSLRSVKDFDVSIIAKNHGGGGHKNAAAFTVNSQNPIVKLLKIVNI